MPDPVYDVSCCVLAAKSVIDISARFSHYLPHLAMKSTPRPQFRLK